MALFEIHIHGDEEKQDRILKYLRATHKLLTRIGETMATQADIDVLTQKAQKGLAEVQTATESLRTEIQALRDQIANGQPLDLTGLENVLNQLDALNPDAPVEEPGTGE